MIFLAPACVSVFALIRKRNEVPIGIPKKAKRWREDWLYSKREQDLGEVFEQWRLPSCYMKEGENPQDALGRIMKYQLGIRGFEASPVFKVFSYYSPSEWYPKENHWDLSFVYDVNILGNALSKSVTK